MYKGRFYCFLIFIIQAEGLLSKECLLSTMEVETIKMSSKGQLVIPKDIREDVDAGEGTLFAVVGSKDTIVLKKPIAPSKATLLKELETIAREGKKRLQTKGIQESDIPDIVHRFRKSKQK